jgi:hypothetical protein
MDHKDVPAVVMGGIAIASLLFVLWQIGDDQQNVEARRVARAQAEISMREAARRALPPPIMIRPVEVPPVEGPGSLPWMPVPSLNDPQPSRPVRDAPLREQVRQLERRVSDLEFELQTR